MMGVVFCTPRACARGAWEEARLALFPGLHAQLLSLATKAGCGGLGARLV